MVGRAMPVFRQVDKAAFCWCAHVLLKYLVDVRTDRICDSCHIAVDKLALWCWYYDRWIDIWEFFAGAQRYEAQVGPEGLVLSPVVVLLKPWLNFIRENNVVVWRGFIGWKLATRSMWTPVFPIRCSAQPKSTGLIARYDQERVAGPVLEDKGDSTHDLHEYFLAWNATAHLVIPNSERALDIGVKFSVTEGVFVAVIALQPTSAK